MSVNFASCISQVQSQVHLELGLLNFLGEFSLIKHGINHSLSAQFSLIGLIESDLLHALGIISSLVREKSSPSLGFRCLPGCCCRCWSAIAVWLSGCGGGKEKARKSKDRFFSFVLYLSFSVPWSRKKMFLRVPSLYPVSTSEVQAVLRSRQDNSGGKMITSCQFDGTLNSAFFLLSACCHLLFRSFSSCGMHFVQDLVTFRGRGRSFYGVYLLLLPWHQNFFCLLLILERIWIYRKFFTMRMNFCFTFVSIKDFFCDIQKSSSIKLSQLKEKSTAFL